MDGQLVKFGILGCANIARKISRAILMTPGVSLYALGSRSLEKAQSFAVANHFPPDTKLHGSYQSVLDDEAVDAVYIPLPTSLHLEWVLKAVDKKKHVLLEKPPALTIEDLDKIISACEKQGVQLMDGTMWVHHPRAAKMKELLKNSEICGDVLEIHSSFSSGVPPNFLKEDIRVKPDLDALGALGDLGWYSIRAVLWAVDYELPENVTALPGAKLNDAGVILQCGASLLWRDGRVATIHCSFLSHMAMKLTVYGTKGMLEIDDFVLPFKEDVAQFNFSAGASFNTIHTAWSIDAKSIQVYTDLPQECLMVKKFSSLVKGIRDDNGKLDPLWFMITRKTQLVLNGVKKSIENGYTTVTL
eukprot:c29077_g1_i1 orf=467-1543(+)